jgi:hypothetical protein
MKYIIIHKGPHKSTKKRKLYVSAVKEYRLSIVYLVVNGIRSVAIRSPPEDARLTIITLKFKRLLVCSERWAVISSIFRVRGPVAKASSSSGIELPSLVRLDSSKHFHSLKTQYKPYNKN